MKMLTGGFGQSKKFTPLPNKNDDTYARSESHNNRRRNKFNYAAHTG